MLGSEVIWCKYVILLIKSFNGLTFQIRILYHLHNSSCSDRGQSFPKPRRANMRNTKSSQSTPISFRNRHRVSAVAFVVSVGCSLFLSGMVQGADITWTNGNSGWDTAINWSPNAIPGANDRAFFNDSAASAGYAVGLNISNDVVGNVLFSGTTKGVFWK